MTLSIANQLNAATEESWSHEIVDIFLSGAVLPWFLMSNQKKPTNFKQVKFADTIRDMQLGDTTGDFGGGLYYRVPLIFALGANIGGFGSGTSINASAVEFINAARYSSAAVVASQGTGWDEKIKNVGTAARVKLVQEKLERLKIGCKQMLAYAIMGSRSAMVTAYGGTAEDYPYGLGDLFNTSTSTKFGDICEDDMALWKANVADTKTMGLEMIQEMMRVPNKGEELIKQPNLIITTPTLRDAYELPLQSQMQYRSNELAAAGFQHVMFRTTVPIVADPLQTAGYCDALNLEHLAIRTHPDPDLQFPTPVWTVINPQKPFDLFAWTMWGGNLITNNRNAHVRYTTVTAP